MGGWTWPARWPTSSSTWPTCRWRRSCWPIRWTTGCKTYPLLAGNWTLRLVALFLVVMAIHIVVSFPLSFYSGHLLEHQFKLSTQTFGRWLWQYLKRNLLAVALSLAMVVGLYWLIWTTHGAWWLVAAGAFFVVSVVLGQLAPVLILPLFYRIEKLDAAGTHRLASPGWPKAPGCRSRASIACVLARRRSRPTPCWPAWATPAASCWAIRCCAGFTPDEIEVIFAHEIGHHVFHHIRKIILAGLLYSAAGFWLCDRLLMAWVAHRGAPFDYAQLPVDTLPLLLLILTVFSLLSQPLQNAVSRRFERQSDAYALRADRAERRLSLGLSQAGPAQQGRPQSPLARRASLPRPPADRRAVGNGGGSGEE